MIKERDPNQYFDFLPPNQDEDETNPNKNSNGEEIDLSVFWCSGSSAEDMAHVRILGLGVVDDNQPAPENIPNNELVEETNQQWGWDGVDH